MNIFNIDELVLKTMTRFSLSLLSPAVDQYYLLKAIVKLRFPVRHVFSEF